jgi:hypothetical protein
MGGVRIHEHRMHLEAGLPIGQQHRHRLRRSAYSPRPVLSGTRTNCMAASAARRRSGSGTIRRSTPMSVA